MFNITCIACGQSLQLDRESSGGNETANQWMDIHREACAPCTPYEYCIKHGVDSDDEHDHHDCYVLHPLS